MEEQRLSSSVREDQGTRLGSLIKKKKTPDSLSNHSITIGVDTRMWLCCGIKFSFLGCHGVEQVWTMDTAPCSTSRDTSDDPQLVWIMPTLDTRGKIAAAELAFYAPIAALSLVLIIRYAFRRDAGWFFLFIFSASVYYFVSVRKPYNQNDQLI